ncbi:MAG TPA: DUF6516 family protein [Bryobacteraceae bacterium]
MDPPGRDHAPDVLLDLDGQVLVDPKGDYWVKFSVQRVEPSIQRPHGLNYSLPLHGPNGERVLGFDNAHAIRQSAGPGGRKSVAADHRHRMGSVRPYRFKDAASLLEDFWREVDKFLSEQGVI